MLAALRRQQAPGWSRSKVTQTHDWRTNVNFDKNTTKTFLKRIEFVRIRREILRLDREIIRLIRLGKGNSPLVKGLEFQEAKLLQEQHIS
jgi:hypothetical protein